MEVRSVFSARLLPRAAALLALLFMAQTVLAGGWSLQDSKGVTYSQSGEQGKWVLINFWAPWCSSCLEEMPDLNALHKRHKNLLIIGVAVMYRKKQDVFDIVHKKALTYPIVLGNEGIASEFGEMQGMPTSFLYSPSGKLVGRHAGSLKSGDVEQAMRHAHGASAIFTPAN